MIKRLMRISSQLFSVDLLVSFSLGQVRKRDMSTERRKQACKKRKEKDKQGKKGERWINNFNKRIL